jgi:hypothetical protein
MTTMNDFVVLSKIGMWVCNRSSNRYVFVVQAKAHTQRSSKSSDSVMAVTTL